MQTRKSAIAVALVIIALGLAWLLNAMNVIAGVDWIWVIGLGVSGILLISVCGLDRFNFVIGTCLIVSSILSLLRQTGKLTINIEAPILFTTLGIVLLLAHLLKIPAKPTEEKAAESPKEGVPK